MRQKKIHYIYNDAMECMDLMKEKASGRETESYRRVGI